MHFEMFDVLFNENKIKKLFGRSFIKLNQKDIWQKIVQHDEKH